MPARTVLPSRLRRGPFTSAQARDLGLSPRALQGPAVVRLFHDVYLAADVPVTLTHRVAGALLVLPPGTVVGGVTALQLLGLDLGPAMPLRFWTTWPRQVRRPGLRVCRLQNLPVGPTGQLTGAAVFATAASDLGLVDLTAAGDFLCRQRLVDRAELEVATDISRGGAAVVRRAAALVQDRVDSPRETLVRLMLVMAGLPEPDVNVPYHDVHGLFLGTPDLTYRRWQVAIEYEGDHHRSDARQWAYDLGRYEQMTLNGLLMLRVTKGHTRRARALVLRVDAALRTRGYTGPAPTFDAEWVALFERGAR